MENLKKYVNGLNVTDNLSEILDIMDTAKPRVTFWGTRVIEVKGYRGSYGVRELAQKIFQEISEEQLQSERFLVEKRCLVTIQLLETECSDQLSHKNWITRIIAYIRSWFSSNQKFLKEVQQKVVSLDKPEEVKIGAPEEAPCVGLEAFWNKIQETRSLNPTGSLTIPIADSRLVVEEELSEENIVAFVFRECPVLFNRSFVGTSQPTIFLKATRCTINFRWLTIMETILNVLGQKLILHVEDCSKEQEEVKSEFLRSLSSQLRAKRTELEQTIRVKRQQKELQDLAASSGEEEI
ncbi:MAG: hypothetical protein JW769_04960 [Parachlamydiales bacterium]|nr:hypothetical protein [Parachlamydiales bacterium]